MKSNLFSTNESDDALVTWSYQQCGSKRPKLCGGNTTQFPKGLQDFILISHSYFGNANGPNIFLEFVTLWPCVIFVTPRIFAIIF